GTTILSALALWKALTFPSTNLLLIGATFQCVSHHDAALTIIFSWSRQNYRACLQWLVSTQLAHSADQVLPDCGGISNAA
ncbi:MAG: hypothetical protein WB762_25770, partial [Candidatus Sulfotelmatobacter sp.]